MLTKLKLKRGEGKLLDPISEIRARISRAELPQSPPQVSTHVVLEALVIMSHGAEPASMS